MAAQLVRKERTGSIFYRITGLLRANQLKWEDRPLWYDIYAAHPPLFEAVWNAKYPKQNEPVRSIFYKEDVVRAQFYKRIRALGAISVENTKTKSLSQFFIEKYMEEENKNPSESEDETFERTIKALQELGVKLNMAKQLPQANQPQTSAK